jgi:hypothetical protein
MIVTKNRTFMKHLNFNLVGSVKLVALSLIISNLGSGAWAAGRAASRQSANSQARTEIVFTDSQAAVLKADTSKSGAQVVAAGQKLEQPFGICACPNGEYLVTDTGCMALIGVNPSTGDQRLVSAGGILGVPFGIAAERNGAVLVANGASLIRIDPATGAQSVASTGGFFQVPVAVAVAANGNIFVVDIFGSVIQVSPRTGAQTLVASGRYLNRPQGIAVKGHDIYVTDVATSDGNFGVGRIIHIDARNGRQTVLSEGEYLVGPVGISMMENGLLVIADPYTINEDSPNLFDGGIIVVNATNGSQTLVARGQEAFVNPRCVMVPKFSAVE